MGCKKSGKGVVGCDGCVGDVTGVVASGTSGSGSVVIGNGEEDLEVG